MPLMTSEKEDKTVFLQVPVPESLRIRLKIEALKKGMSLKDLAQDILEKALKELEEGK